MRPLVPLMLLLIAPVASAENETDATPQATEEPRLIDARMRSPARPVERAPPRYPPRELRSGHEGWVDVSFVVEADGSVADPVIESSSGIRGFELAALRAVQEWQYSPALENGEPIRQCETRVRLTFHLDRGEPGARPAFIRRYRQVERMLQEDRGEEALTAAQALIDSVARNLYEVNRAWVMRAMVEQHLDASPTNRLHSLYRATTHGVDGLGSRELLIVLLENRLALEVESRLYQRALTTGAELLKHVRAGSEQHAQIERFLDQIRNLRDSEAYLSVHGHIDQPALLEEQPALWTHQPLRRKFGIEDIDGELSYVDLRCEWQRVLMTWAPDVAYRLPEDWGTCDVYVYGAPGTTFTLVEYPLL